MNLHELQKSKGSTHRIKRLGRGRGSGLGKTSGKGHKGQMARTGHKRKPTFEGGQNRLVTSVPIRGFNNINRQYYIPVNVCDLAKFDAGTTVDLDALKTAGLAKGPKGSKIKVLGRGELSVKLDVKANGFSASARQKIEAAGGTCEIV